jgi:hypothetical protein
VPRRGATIGELMRETLKSLIPPEIPKMNNDNSEHDFDSIAELLQRQTVVLEVLVHHLAGVEAAALVLVLQTLPEEALNTVREVKDHILSEIHEKMIADTEHDFEDP